MEKFFKFGKGIPVVIDVLRASSTIITALKYGIKELIPVNSKEKAFYYKSKIILLIGEKNGIKIEKFDLGNSPLKVKQLISNPENKYIKGVIKTSNATDILCSISRGYIVSTLNLKFAINALKNKKISIMIAGGKYGITEDLIVGLALYGGVYGDVKISKKNIKDNILRSKAAKHLRKIGYASDINFIIKNMNKFNILPKLNNKKIY